MKAKEVFDKKAMRAEKRKNKSGINEHSKKEVCEMSMQQTLDSNIIKERAKIKCEICDKEFERITSTHLKKHDITPSEYKEKFPDALLVSEGLREKMSEAQSGKPSPMKGKYHTEESKQKMSKPRSENGKQHIRDNQPNRSGKNNPFYGKGYLISGEKNGNYGKRGKETSMYGRTGEKCPAYQGGISFLPYCEKFDNDLKERVRDFFDRKCYICGKNEADNGRKLDVHHVNYNKMVCCNDVKPLFVPLCISCHAKTSGDREYWEEFFTVRLEYLTDGQCFYQKGCRKMRYEV